MKGFWERKLWKRWKWVPVLFCAVLLMWPGQALALFDGGWLREGSVEGSLYTVSADDAVLFIINRQVSVGDLYVAEDNAKYRISVVDDKQQTAQATFVETITLPEALTWAGDDAVQAAKSGDTGKTPTVCLYCTHTDESYVPSDGTESQDEGGGILDVAQAFQGALEVQGFKVVLDETNHVPHDAGAYRRSRRTAIGLIKSEQPTAVFDIHRDATPVEEYEAEVDGQQASRVRIVIGRKNPNQDVNEELAYRVKAIADKEYPGLIKDVFIGKGAYNQELSPRSLLLEFGTHEMDKERVIEATKPLAQVVAKVFDVQGSNDQAQVEKTGQETAVNATEKPNSTQAQGSQVSRKNTTETGQKDKSNSAATGASKGAGSGIVWLLLVVGVGAAVLFFVSNSGKEMRARLRGKQ